MLRNIRQKKGLTVEQVSNVLSIEKRFIEGIESGDWKSLPEPFFVKGYVSHYIAFLGIADELPARSDPREKNPVRIETKAGSIVGRGGSDDGPSGVLRESPGMSGSLGQPALT